MKCEATIQEAALYLYGELTAEEEERFESHADACSACTAEIERMRSVGRCLDQRRLEPSPALLAECRQDLLKAMQQTEPASRHWPSLRGAFLGPFTSPIFGLRQLAAAAALVTLGFVAARATMKGAATPGVLSSGGAYPAGAAGFDPGSVVSDIRLQPGPAGNVQIGLNETKSITGSPNDPHILQLLLIAARDQADPGLRLESIQILKDHSDSAEVRKALLQALGQDPNPGVRLKALEGLKSFHADAATRRVLAHALLSDDNPAVRIEAIELLTQDRDDELVGMLQDLFQKEQNNYVRQRCRNALRDMNASVGAF